ncbi:hypothetical protein M5K25_000111 [Dendrobium thyrsiflorum]|uniref:Proteasome subunit alpha type n=1 Tax=Dendrobium thyrsiflorum TaxID=117978 RepID=A0ABD0VSQ9_DENTH
MSSIGTGYDLSVTTFSPDGRVFQIEYAAKAIDKSGTVIAIKCKDGIVMGVEKLIPWKMVLGGSYRRIQSVHRHSGMVTISNHFFGSRKISAVFFWMNYAEVSKGDADINGGVSFTTISSLTKGDGDGGCKRAVAGFSADGRQILARAKSEATNYERIYGEPIPVKELADRVASYVHLCTLYWWLRPFGCGVILGGYDRDGPGLYMVEPSGVSYRYFGAAIGKGKQAAKT